MEEPQQFTSGQSQHRLLCVIELALEKGGDKPSSLCLSPEDYCVPSVIKMTYH